MFILSFLIIHRLVLIAVWFAKKFFNILTLLPFVSLANRISGGIFGLFEGAVFAGMAVYGLSKIPLSDKLTAYLSTSPVAGKLQAFGGYALTWVPTVLEWMQKGVQYGEGLIKNWI